MRQITLILLASLITASYGQCISYDCIFNGIQYQPGDLLQFVCFQLNCTPGGTWEFTNVISDECSLCWISNDPHFTTFDQTYYDWHGTCNYSISQPINCTGGNFDSYYPPYGIYGQFASCSPYVSCLQYTTYKVDPYTALLIIHSGSSVSIQINGNAIPIPSTPGVPTDCSGTYYYPVVIWYDGTSVRIIGIDYSIQAWPNYMLIYTTQSHLFEIAGLCGFYTGNPTDDFSMRPCGPVASTVPPFAVSWKTNTFPKNCTDEPRTSPWRGKRRRRQTASECEEQYLEKCKQIVMDAVNVCGQPNDPNTVNNAIANCLKDCCALPETCDKWMKTASSLICDIGRNSQMQGGRG